MGTTRNFRVVVASKENFIEYSDDIEMIFIELPKFKKSLEEVEKVRGKD